MRVGARTALRRTLAVTRQELHGYLRAPVAYGIGALFLAVQGLAFAAQVAALSDPRRPGPIGAVLEGYFAGTLLTWILGLAVITLLAMRTVAEERRSGGWELLITAPVAESQAIVGKWLAASLFHAILWLPTAAYLVVVAAWSPTGASWEWAPILCAYAGVIGFGAAMLAVALAAAASATNPLVAGAAAFATLVALLVVGDLPTLWPDLASDHPSIVAGFEAVSIRAHVTELARGEVTAGAVVLAVGLTLVGLSGAITLVCRGRRQHRAVRLRAASTTLLAIITALGLVLVTRHPLVWDATGAGVNSLDPESVRILRALDRPIEVVVVRPTLPALEPVYEQVERVLARITRVQPRVRVTHLDPAAAASNLAPLAHAAGLAAADLGGSGALVVQVGARRRVIDLLEIAGFGRDELSAPAITRLAVEAEVVSRLRELVDERPWTVCVVAGHGEAALAPPAPAADSRADWVAVGERLRVDGARLERIEEVTAEGLRACTVVTVVAPARPWPMAEAFALVEYLRSGGSALLAIGPDSPVLTGLEPVLGEHGLALAAAVAVDPDNAVGGPGALRIVDGYTAHPVNDGFARRRITVWQSPRVVEASGAAMALLVTGARGWGETRLDAPPALDPADRPGPVAIAAALERGESRLVVLGASALSPDLAGGANELWAVAAVRWLARRELIPLAVADRTPTVTRLLMTSAERRGVIAACVAGVPLAFVLVGISITLLRRRRGRRA